MDSRILPIFIKVNSYLLYFKFYTIQAKVANKCITEKMRIRQEKKFDDE